MSPDSDFMAWMDAAVVKTAAMRQNQVDPASVGVAPAGTDTPGPTVGQTLGTQTLPWQGGLVGAAGGLAYGLFAGDDDDDWVDHLRRAAVGATAGAGAQTGMRVGGSLASRHARQGGSSGVVGATPVVATALGGFAPAAFLHTLLRRRRRGRTQ